MRDEPQRRQDRADQMERRRGGDTAAVRVSAEKWTYVIYLPHGSKPLGYFTLVEGQNKRKKCDIKIV